MKSKILLFLIIALALILRVYQVSALPLILNRDEAALAYNAYLLEESGLDEWQQTWPIAFKSFGDYKAPLYFYLTAVSEFFFGLNKTAVRLPANFFWFGHMCFGLLFCELIMEEKEFCFDIRTLCLQFPPGIFCTADLVRSLLYHLFFLMAGLLFFFLWLKQKMKFALFLSAGGFVFSIYAYHSARLTSFLLLLALCLIYGKEIIKRAKEVVFPAIFGAIVALPLLAAMISKSDELMRRPMAISIFNDEGLKRQIVGS